MEVNIKYYNAEIAKDYYVALVIKDSQQFVLLKSYYKGDVFMNFDINIISIIISVVIGTLSILISIVIYFKSKKTKRIMVEIVSTALITKPSNEYPALQIYYGDESVDSLISTTINIISVGTDTVYPQDFARSSPISIRTDQKFLFDNMSEYEVISSNKLNSALLDVKNNSLLELKFDFLKPKDKIMMTVLHTGELSVDVPLISEDVEICYPQKIDNINPSDKINLHKRNDENNRIAMILFCMYFVLLFILNQMILPIVGDLTKYILITERLHLAFTFLIIAFVSVRNNRV